MQHEDLALFPEPGPTTHTLYSLYLLHLSKYGGTRKEVLSHYLGGRNTGFITLLYDAEILCNLKQIFEKEDQIVGS